MEEMPYALKIQNIAGYIEDCQFCGDRYCRNHCPVPFSSKLTVLDMLHKIGVEDNCGFFEDRRGSKNDFILNILWNKDVDAKFIKEMSGTAQGVKLVDDGDDNTNKEQDLTLMDCFEEFRKPELLDDDNKWYCNKCKDHVRATKQMEIFKCPPVMVINLKRFKQSGGGSRFFGLYGGGGYGQKIDTQVDFPLDGLDMTNLVQGKLSREGANAPQDKLIYDCYAVSNHYGNMGFGHYTAYCRSPIDDKWYEFDDSRVS